MTLAPPPVAGVPGRVVDVPAPRVARDETRFPLTRATPDIVDEWGRGSFPASDPPANW